MQTSTKTKEKLAKQQAFRDLKMSEPYYYIPFTKWLSTYVFTK